MEQEHTNEELLRQLLALDHRPLKVIAADVEVNRGNLGAFLVGKPTLSQALIEKTLEKWGVLSDGHLAGLPRTYDLKVQGDFGALRLLLEFAGATRERPFRLIRVICEGTPEPTNTTPGNSEARQDALYVIKARGYRFRVLHRAEVVGNSGILALSPETLPLVAWGEPELIRLPKSQYQRWVSAKPVSAREIDVAVAKTGTCTWDDLIAYLDVCGLGPEDIKTRVMAERNANAVEAARRKARDPRRSATRNKRKQKP